MTPEPGGSDRVSVVIAPDSFKGSIPADEASRAIAAGWSSLRPQDRLSLVPMADGGEGTIAAVRAGLPDAVLVPLTTVGSTDQPQASAWLRVPRADGDIGIVELAASSGLDLQEELRPLDTHTYGLGASIKAALDAGVAELLVCLGGSSSTDGGAGALRALGARFLDPDGNDVPLGNRGLASLSHIEWEGLSSLPHRGVHLLCDVTNPLLGDRGAARVFGPQKGAEPAQVELLELNLSNFAEAVLRGKAIDPALPGAGAAGGTAYGLAAWGADLVGGAGAVARIVGLEPQASSADLVITGEGRFDSQTEGGKVVSFVQALARGHGVPTILVCGQLAAEAPEFFDVYELSALANDTRLAMEEPARWLTEAGRQAALRFTRGGGPSGTRGHRPR